MPLPRTALKAAVVGAAIGLAVLGLAFVLAGWWYASAVGILALVLAPGLVAGGMLNPIDSGTYFATAVVVQAVCYALLGVGVSILLQTVSRRGRNAA